MYIIKFQVKEVTSEKHFNMYLKTNMFSLTLIFSISINVTMKLCADHFVISTQTVNFQSKM